MADAKLSYRSQQTDKGTAYMVVSGEFDFSDDIADFFNAVRASGATVLLFNSNGGNVKKSMELGRAIRLLRMTTVQLRGDECASACSLAFMGGLQRYAQPGSIGVHKSSFADTRGLTVEEAVSTVQKLTADVIAYMTEMGVDPALLSLSFNYESSDIRYLSGSEMRQYRLAENFPNADNQQQQTARSTLTPAAPPPSDQPAAPLAPQAYAPAGNPAVTTLTQPPVPEPSLSIPTARNGRVQHPKGFVTLRAAPDSSKAVAKVTNGEYLTIIGDTEKWFQVQVGNKVGYMHHSWVWISQFEAAPFGTAFVQVKSFDNLEETRQYIQSSTLPLSAYLATNGWFAITLNRTFADGQYAAKFAQDLKKSQVVPEDSMATYGNAFVRKVCCSK